MLFNELTCVSSSPVLLLVQRNRNRESLFNCDFHLQYYHINVLFVVFTLITFEEVIDLTLNCTTWSLHITQCEVQYCQLLQQRHTLSLILTAVLIMNEWHVMLTDKCLVDTKHTKSVTRQRIIVQSVYETIPVRIFCSCLSNIELTLVCGCGLSTRFMLKTVKGLFHPLYK